MTHGVFLSVATVAAILAGRPGALGLTARGRNTFQRVLRGSYVRHPEISPSLHKKSAYVGPGQGELRPEGVLRSTDGPGPALSGFLMHDGPLSPFGA